TIQATSKWCAAKLMGDKLDMTNEEMFVNAAVTSWKIVIGRLDKGIQPLGEEQLQRQVAPGRNRLYYLVGHLTAVHDRMFPMLGLGDRLHPELDEPYITTPDRPLSALD